MVLEQGAAPSSRFIIIIIVIVVVIVVIVVVVGIGVVVYIVVVDIVFVIDVVVVDVDVEAEAIVRAAKGADKALIDAVTVFDVFAGDKAEAQMGAGKKSVAFSVRLQPKSGTLTDEEIETVAAKVVAAVAKASGGELRG